MLMTSFSIVKQKSVEMMYLKRIDRFGWLEERNKGGELLGRLVEMVVYDNVSNTGKAVTYQGSFLRGFESIPQPWRVFDGKAGWF